MPEDDRIVKDSDKVYDLVDIIEEEPGETASEGVLNEEIIRKVEEIADRVARQMFPSIAERIIKEEIEALKKKIYEK